MRHLVLVVACILAVPQLALPAPKKKATSTACADLAKRTAALEQREHALDQREVSIARRERMQTNRDDQLRREVENLRAIRGRQVLE